MKTEEKCPRHFHCEVCHKDFHKGWSEEERDQEAVRNGFGNIPKEDLMVVCTPCYKEAMKRIGPIV